MASDCADPKLILVALQSRPVPLYAFAILGVGWFLWVLPFFLVNKQKQPAKQVDKRALGNYSRRSGLCDLVAGALLGDAAAALARCVKRNFLCVRRAAFLNGSARPRPAVARGRRPHRRSSTGDSWAVSRRAPSHLPIHVCTLCATGFLFAPWWLFVPSLLFFVAGTEIRVHIEEKLLEAHFGEQFAEFKRRVPAYIPFLR